jgi:hypothetical protein
MPIGNLSSGLNIRTDHIEAIRPQNNSGLLVADWEPD